LEEKSPHTRSDILELLRLDKMVDLVKEGKLDKVMGCVFKWGHALLLQIGSSKWSKEGVERWLNRMGYTCVMGTHVVGVASCSTHGFVRCFKVTATHSLQTQIRKIERVNYKHQLIVPEMIEGESGETITTMDLEGELPAGMKMKEKMMRKGGFIFKVKIIDGKRSREWEG
jgi:hypothetical protein